MHYAHPRAQCHEFFSQGRMCHFDFVPLKWHDLVNATLRAIAGTKFVCQWQVGLVKLSIKCLLYT